MYPISYDQMSLEHTYSNLDLEKSEVDQQNQIRE